MNSLSHLLDQYKVGLMNNEFIELVARESAILRYI